MARKPTLVQKMFNPFSYMELRIIASEGCGLSLEECMRKGDKDLIKYITSHPTKVATLHVEDINISTEHFPNGVLRSGRAKYLDAIFRYMRNGGTRPEWLIEEYGDEDDTDEEEPTEEPVPIPHIQHNENSQKEENLERRKMDIDMPEDAEKAYEQALAKEEPSEDSQVEEAEQKELSFEDYKAQIRSKRKLIKRPVPKAGATIKAGGLSGLEKKVEDLSTEVARLHELSHLSERVRLLTETINAQADAIGELKSQVKDVLLLNKKVTNALLYVVNGMHMVDAEEAFMTLDEVPDPTTYTE